jgi:ABC-2 type transport system permease protein
MNEFIGFVKKEFLHIFRDPRTLIILFGIPVVLILVFGFVIRNEIQDVKIAILDQAKDVTSLEITNRLTSSGYFDLMKNLSSADEIEKEFRKGRIREVVIFEPHFGENLNREGKATVQIIADASDPNSAKLIVGYTQGIITGYIKEMNSNASIPYQIIPKVRMMFNPDLKSAFMFVPGTMAMILMLVCALMTSISIAREKEVGTMEALLVSPLKPLQIISGKVTPYIMLSCINALIIIVMGHFIFKLPIHGSLWLLFFETLLFITLALSLGIMISSIANNQMMAMFISAFALMLPTILLSGFIFPIENMPKILQLFTYILPPRYFITIIRSVMLKGIGLAEIWKETLVLLGMAVFYIGVSTAKFKVRLEQ